MKLQKVELVRVAMPLVRPFRTSFGIQETRDVLLVHVFTDVGEGWGECAAHAEPFYNEEFTESAVLVLQRWLIPAVMALPEVTGAAVAHACRQVKGYRAAKAGLEMAVLDAEPGRAAEWRAQVAEALQRGLHAGRDIRMGERGYVILGGHAPEGAS